MTVEQLQRRLDREKLARKEAESLLELKSSELYQLNQQLRTVNHRLEDQAIELGSAHQAALESARLKSQFLATMSHEIRTPMNGVLGMLHLLLDTGMQEEQRDFAETARRSAESLLQIINDILDFSRIESGKLALENIDFELRAEIQDTLDLMKEKAQAKCLKLLCEIDSRLPHIVSGDPGRIRQILINLLGNALKFTHEGEVSLRVFPAGMDDPVRVRFEVTDSGIGISQEHQEKLFHPFVQADGSTTREYGGTGLGLSIARELVELMGGKIGVISHPGKGSKFWIEISLEIRRDSQLPPGRQIPVEKSVEESVEIEAAHSPPTGKSQGQILIADDNIVNQKVAARMVQHLGYRVQTVSDGQEALEAVRTGAYQLVLMDCQMPRMDGFEATVAIRKLEELIRDVPIIAVTANAMKGDREKCLGAGMNDYLSKPFRPDQLRALIEQYIGVQNEGCRP